MSLKENVSAIKEELSSEEKFFEKMVNFEYFYKKYKVTIWIVIIAIVAYFGTSTTLGMMEESRVESANNAYQTLQEDPNNKEALAALKAKSNKLYDLFQYTQAVEHADLELFKTLSSSKTYMIADMAKYNYAVLSGDDKALKAYVNSGVYFKDIAIINYAAGLIKQDKVKEAKNLLSRIAENSPLYQQAQMLGHYGITQK